MPWLLIWLLTYLLLTLPPGGVAGGGAGRPEWSTKYGEQVERLRRAPAFAPPFPPHPSGGGFDRFSSSVTHLRRGEKRTCRPHRPGAECRPSAVSDGRPAGGSVKSSGSDPGLNPVATRSGIRSHRSRTHSVLDCSLYLRSDRQARAIFRFSIFQGPTAPPRLAAGPHTGGRRSLLRSHQQRLTPARRQVISAVLMSRREGLDGWYEASGWPRNGRPGALGRRSDPRGVWPRVLVFLPYQEHRDPIGGASTTAGDGGGWKLTAPPGSSSSRRVTPRRRSPAKTKLVPPLRSGLGPTRLDPAERSEEPALWL